MKPSRFPLRPIVATIQALLICSAFPLPTLAAEDIAVDNSAAASRQYDIPAGSLAESLSRFAGAAGVTLAFDAGQLSGLRSPGLQGQYTVTAGFAKLLAGSGYEALPTGGQRYSLRRLPAPAAGETALKPVTVTAQGADSGALPQPYAGGQVAKGGRLGLLGNAHFLDTPFSQTSYTLDVIEQQQARSLSDLLVSDPSVRLSSARTNIGEDFSIRGFSVASADVAFNGMYGLMPYFRVPVEMAERVEVLKGPSALLNGMPPSGNVGGAINIIPKRAGNDPLTRLTASYLSDSIAGVHADIGRRFGENKEFGVRFNAAWRDGDTAYDKQKQTDQVYTLGLDYQGERLRASLDVIHQDQDIKRVVRQLIAGAALTEMPKAPDASLNYPGYGRSQADDTAVVGRVEYDLNDRITIYGGLGKREQNLDALAGNPTLLNTAGDITSSAAWQIFRVNNKSWEVGANANFATGPIKHKLAVNYSRVETKADIDFDTFWAARTSNIYNPVYSPMPDIGSALAGSSPAVDRKKYYETTLSSFALADTLSFLDDRLKLTLGARHQNVQQQYFLFTTNTSKYDESKLTPVAGIVFQPQSNIALYASYIEGLSAGSKAPLPLTTVIPPVKTKQYEIGSKIDWGRFATTFSLFQIERPSAGFSGADYGLHGEQRNRGAEFGVFGEIARNVRLLGGLTLMEGKLTKLADGAAAGVVAGNDAVAVPRVQASLGIDWDNSLAPGVALNARVVHTGKQYADQANQLKLPAWTRLDVGARYRTRIGEKAVLFRANVENLFDKNYWASSNEGYIYIGTPRTLMLSATVDF